MSIKRNRSAYEADLQTKQSPFVAYGTPLPALDENIRDDGSFKPVWQQEVVDERGRKRLHGAFTGGFSAGYFNTVGSKDGWTPATFVSSRSNRKKDEKQAQEQRPEDFMDEEDLADAADAQKVQTAEGFAGLGSTEGDVTRRSGLLDLFRMEGETVGVKLLKKMGWREGQGVGPKIRRKARLGGMENPGEEAELHLFAPENTQMIGFLKKDDQKGLGFEGEAKLGQGSTANDSVKSDDDEDQFLSSKTEPKKKKKPSVRGGIGIGILNDTGSDDEDPYEIGPRISYNKVIGGDKKKKKPLVNGAIRPVFISKKAANAKASAGFRKCHDGRLPLDGFVLSSNPNSLSSIITSDGKYVPPGIPEGWKSTKKHTSQDNSVYLSTSDAAKESKLDPKARALLLGEAPLPGKSVFDFLSSAARDRLVTASGKSNLPAALGEVPQGYNLNPEEKQRELFRRIPKLDKDVAIAALGRGASGWMPYAEDEGKRSRYLGFLEGQAGMTDRIPDRALNVTKDDWLKELQEFAHCAQIFKPMTGMMATRFTTSSSAPKLASDSPAANESETLLSKPTPKPEDPAEAAAKLGMFGPLTRSTQDFHPSRLLCKRFNVRPPAHVQLDPERSGNDMGDSVFGGAFPPREGSNGKSLDLVSKSAINEMLRESGSGGQNWTSSGNSPADVHQLAIDERPSEVVIDTERNEALESEKAGEAVFRAIFGDDSDDD